MKRKNVMKGLLNGYRAFHSKYFAKGQDSVYKGLVEKGQSPKIMMIACSDSRVDPGIILNCEPGEVFVVRNVANLVPPCENDTKHHGTSAALEFAVCFLEVEHIIVLGHTHCGGIRALLAGEAKPSSTHGFIASWMDIARSAKTKAIAEKTSGLEREKRCGEYSLMASIDNLHTFPWIKERVEAGNLNLHAWHFDLETGMIENYNPETRQFENILADGKMGLFSRK